MQHVLSNWNEIEKNLENHFIMLFLDYDGTLTPIVDDPGRAGLPFPMREMLHQLVTTAGLKIALISGRSLKDLKKHVDIEGLLYAGNHGLEYEDPEISYVRHEALAFSQVFSELADLLGRELNPFPGVIVEDKKLTLSVHYRQLAPEKIEQVKTAFFKIVEPYVLSSNLVISEGKKVWEIKPPTEWNKGTLVLWLMSKWMIHAGTNIFPIYLGDDQTDEDAFRILKEKGMGIKVTHDEKEPSEARYYLQTPEEVFEFLKRLKVLKEKSG